MRRRLCLITFFILGAFALVFGSATLLYQRQVNKAVEIIYQDLGRELSNQSIYSAENRLALLREIGFTGLSLESDYRDPNSQSSRLNCWLSSTYPVTVDGLNVGTISDCVTATVILGFAAHSPIIWGGIFLVFLVALITYFIPLISYKSKIVKFIRQSKANRDLVNDENKQQDLVVAEIHNIIQSLSSTKVALEKANQQKAQQQALGLLAAQVAHDIRSPLSALYMMMSVAKELPEDRRLIMQRAIQRINDIANGLLKQGSNRQLEFDTNDDSAARESVMLVALLDCLVSEKRTQNRERIDVEIEASLAKGYGLFANVNPAELSRVISNLINNSVEAFDGTGRVNIAVSRSGGNSVIMIEDNGKGIPPDVLSKLGERGISYGKEGTQAGSGLGVFHAKQTIEAAGGKFQIESTLGHGTRVTLTLPLCPQPGWFLDKLTLKAGHTLVSVDDDQSIHQIWAGRLASLGSKGQEIEHLKFTSLEQFSDWYEQNANRPLQFLVDYEFLHQSGNGLELIESLQIIDRSVLVTSRFEEPQIQKRAEALGLKILPKGLAASVPLEIAKEKLKLDAVLIDDDPLVRATWRLMADEKSKNIRCFANPEDFYQEAGEFDFQTPIHIDVSLGDSVRGETVAIKVNELGFTKINLTTGYSADSIKAPACVSQVIGKELRM